MTDDDIKYIVRIVADAAWGLASREADGEGDTDRNLCLRIEDLSDDPVVSKQILAHVKARLARDYRSPDWEMCLDFWFAASALEREKFITSG